MDCSLCWNKISGNDYKVFPYNQESKKGFRSLGILGDLMPADDKSVLKIKEHYRLR